MYMVVGVAALCLLGGSGPTVVQAEPAPDWNARFAAKSGWIGGDGVASAVLGRDRVLWLFGDTIVGAVKDGGRTGTMVNNSLGLQTRAGKDGAIRFVFGKQKSGKPTAFLVPADGRGWFWPVSAIRSDKKLYLFCTQVEQTEGKGVFAFRPIANWLVVADNPDDEPEAWRLRQVKVPFARFEADRECAWGSACLAHQGDLFVYGYLHEGNAIGGRQLTTARVPIAKIEDFAAWTFQSKTGWSTKAADAVGGPSGLATEFTASQMAGGKQFVLVYTENGLSDRILGRFATQPAGPWSEPKLLYRCPEMAADKGVFTYAGKAHAWAAADSLLISYCSNTWDFGRLFRDEAVYRPKFVRVKLQP